MHSDDRLHPLLAIAREAWPALEVADAEFLAHVARHAAQVEDVSTLHAADLYLAYACARGDRAALEAFERVYFGEIEKARRRRSDLTTSREDVEQAVRERLLVGESPRIAEYSGRGPLHAWFRVAVVRLISNLAARPQREVSVEADVLAAFPVLTADPELDYLRRMYKAELEAALRDAIASLSRQDRLLVRRSLVENLSIDELAVLHGAHRATLARWIARARDALLSELHASLMRRLSIDRAELTNVLGLVRSQFDVTLERLFQTQTT